MHCWGRSEWLIQSIFGFFSFVALLKKLPLGGWAELAADSIVHVS